METESYIGKEKTRRQWIRGRTRGKRKEGKKESELPEICRRIPSSLWLGIDLHKHDSKLPDNQRKNHWKGIGRPTEMGIAVFTSAKVKRAYNIRDRIHRKKLSQ